MHIEFSQIVRAVLALGFAVCVIGFLQVINTRRNDMAGEAQMARYIALLSGCFAGAMSAAEQLRAATPLGIRVYSTTAFLVAALVALYHTRREVRKLREHESWKGPRRRARR